MTTPNFGIRADLKIGSNRGRPRIWIEGAKLADAGFVGGSTYACYVSKGRITCSLKFNDAQTLLPDPNHNVVRSAWRKVTSKPNSKPVIDISGQDVETAFPAGGRVIVIFQHGYLTIIPKEKGNG